MPGPPPKPAHLRQRTNRKSTATVLALVEPGAAKAAPEIPNPDARDWHPLTMKSWKHAWRSPMASQWLETDFDALGRLALLWDEFYKRPNADALKEIRLQSALFGLSPLDRSRLQWEVSRSESEALKHERRVETSQKRTGRHDPRHALMAIS